MTRKSVEGAATSASSLSTQTDDQANRILEFARRHLEMDVAFIVEFVDGREVYRVLSGDADSFGLHVNASVPGAETYCLKMVEGELPNVIPDTAADARVRDLPVTAEHGIGSYLALPVPLLDGSIFGSFGCVSHGPRALDDRDVRFMRLLGEMLGKVVQEMRDRDREGAQIRRLIETTDLSIVVQPVFDIRGGRCLGVEALSRFPAGFGRPDEVFAAAHRADLGLPLELMAVTEALRVMPSLAADQFLSVNLTPSVAYELTGRQSPNRDYLPGVVLEITEHAAVQSYTKLRERLRQRRDQGLRLAIDDAGAGYASLKHVVELEPDMIKIDRSLIHGCGADRARRSAISAFVTLAADLGATTIAEGVELPDDLTAVRDLGVDAAQGYLLGRPTANRRMLTRWTTNSSTLSPLAAASLPAS